MKNMEHNKLVLLKTMQLGVESFCENLKTSLKESEIPKDIILTVDDFIIILDDFCNSFIEKCNEVVDSTKLNLEVLYNHVIEFGNLYSTLSPNATLTEMLEAVIPHHDILSCPICRDYFDESF